MSHSFATSAAMAAILAVTASHAIAADTTQAAGTPPVLASAPTQESPDQWRASKLAGVAIYGPDNKSVGKITDVLMSHDGKAELVVIGVGGFLGIGQKDVALPFDQVKFTDKPINPPANATAMNGAAGGTTAAGGVRSTINGAAPNGGIDPAAPVGLGTPTGVTTAGSGLGQSPSADTTGSVNALGAGGAGAATAPGAGAGATAGAGGLAMSDAGAGAGAGGVNPGAAMPRSTAYPDHGTIDMTADQLKSAPSFQFAR